MGIRDHDVKRRGRTLDQIEGIDSGMPLPSDTSLVRKCLRLRKLPIGELTVGDLRLMIGQREGLMFLVPLALEHLVNDPLAEGDFYPGDLLSMVLRSGAEFWRRHPDLRDQVACVVAKLPTEIPRAIATALTEFQTASEV